MRVEDTRCRGVFYVSIEHMHDTEKMLVLMRDVIVWRTEHQIDKGVIKFWAECSDFDPIPEYTTPPEYEAILSLIEGELTRRWRTRVEEESR